MKISIITINFNRGDVLLKTIQSVVNQTYSNIEYVVIDGGSSDDSIKIINEHNNFIAYSVSEKDNGVYHAMNKGIEKTTGEYLLFLNSGDYLATEHVIQNMVEKFNAIKIRNKELIFYGNIIVEDKIIPTPKQITLDILSSSSLPHPASFISRELFNKIGRYDENYKIISDWIFFLKAYLNQVRFVYIEQATTVFELNGISSNFNDSEIEKNNFLLKNYPNLIEDFKIFSAFNIYKLSRIHQIVERLRLFFKSIISKTSS